MHTYTHDTCALIQTVKYFVCVCNQSFHDQSVYLKLFAFSHRIHLGVPFSWFNTNKFGCTQYWLRRCLDQKRSAHAQGFTTHRCLAFVLRKFEEETTKTPQQQAAGGNEELVVMVVVVVVWC